MLKSLSIIGAGRLGRALGKLWREQRWTIGAVIPRSEASVRKEVRFIGAGRPHAVMTRQVLASRLILIATPDDAVPSVSQELARIAAEELRGEFVLHTAGALDSTALYALRPFGAALGSMHPMKSFSGAWCELWAECQWWCAWRRRKGRRFGRRESWRQVLVWR